MGKYGRAAELAIQLYGQAGAETPRDAWTTAVSLVFSGSVSSQVKACPRDTFLALCEMGLVRNIPVGSYTKSIKNKAYAVRAIALIRENPLFLEDLSRLWNAVTNHSDKTQNHQMEVVTTLWRHALTSPVGTARHP